VVERTKRLQLVWLSFKVRITTRGCRGHSGMCVVEKEGVDVGSLDSARVSTASSGTAIPKVQYVLRVKKHI
jgi:hypothetical protein